MRGSLATRDGTSRSSPRFVLRPAHSAAVSAAASSFRAPSVGEPERAELEPWLATWQPLATSWQPLVTSWQPGNLATDGNRLATIGCQSPQ
eukprot:5780810-Prymnesium_polylepis.1